VTRAHFDESGAADPIERIHLRREESENQKRTMSLGQIRSRRGQDAMRPSASTALLPALSASRAAVLTVAAAVACLGLPLRASAAEGGNAGASSDFAVTVAAAKNMCFADTLQVTGVLIPKNEILVRPEREGLQISQVLVEPGDTVTSGQSLARLTAGEEQERGSGVAVTTPAAGVVISTSAVVGTVASARGEPLFRIAGQGEMELLAETPVKTLANLEVDQSAKVEVVGVGELTGKVRLFSTAINPTTQLGQVRIFVGSDPRLRAGAFGRATIHIGRRCAPAISLSALLYGPSGAVVQVVRSGRIESRRVVVGLLAQGQAQIREGLAEGETVVVRAGAFLRDGDRVRAMTAGEPPRQ
jgi:HlyD family secretion protein